MIEKILEQIKQTEIGISQWIAGFLGIFFIRFILEVLSSPTRSGIIASGAETLVHYGLFWTALTLGLILIIGHSNRDYIYSAKLALFGMPIIWLAPIFDIVLSRGMGFTESYVFDSGKQIIFNFFTFFGPTLTSGATYGIRLEILLVLIGAFWFLRNNGKNIFQTITTVLYIYAFGFILSSWPGILYTLSHIGNYFASNSLPDVSNYLAKLIFQSNISHNTLREGVTSVSTVKFFDIGFDKLSSQILFLISCGLGATLFWKIDSKKFRAVLGNLRLERIGSYLALLVCGAGFAYLNNLGDVVWVDALGIACLVLSWVGLWMYAVHQNDIADVHIDEISNTDRPLVQKTLDHKSMKEIGYVWLAVALLGSFCAGLYPFFMSLVYIAASHIYSAPPLRLRRFPIIPSFLIGVASLATVLTGFFFISANKRLEIFPPLLSLGIIIMVTLAINVKDMKDIEGDRANGVLTLPVLFGKNGAKITALCFALSFLLVPVFLSFYSLYIFAIPAAIIGYKLVVKKPYREEPIFILRFIFLLCVAVSYIGIYWIAYTQHII